MAEDPIFEERNEFMVSPIGGSPILRTARFLKPTASASAINGGQRSKLKLPSLPFSSEADWPIEVAFSGWRAPQNKWKKWVGIMRAKHLSLWKSAGIEEAIMSSVYKIHRNDDLILGLAERWCSDTDTFVFPWGEATITLEDIMILGGFSVLGCPVPVSASITLQEAETMEIEKSLEKSRKDLVRMNLDNHTKWLKFFMDSESNIEHEAFLSLWLSRFVFPNEFDKIGKHVFPMAVRLAKGYKIALAPAVLASIYRDLSSLRETMEIVVSSNLNSEGNGDAFALTLWAPLCFVQIWAWERIIPLQPPPNRIKRGELRISRWHNLKDFGSVNVRESIDSAADMFLWRPYVLAIDNWEIPKFYKDKELMRIDDEEMNSFLHCLRVSEVVGIDCCNEPYRPNRVAMQFGFDQDIPEWIPRSKKSKQIAWCEYIRPLGDNVRLCLSSRLSESDVTTRYLKWWRKSLTLLPCDANLGILHGRRSSRKAKRFNNLQQVKGENVLQQVKGENVLRQVKVENVLDVPPGFPPKSLVFKGNNHTSTPMVQPCKMHNAKEKNSSRLDYDLIASSPSYNEDSSMHNGNQENFLSSDVPPGFTPRP